jgi:Fe-S oxidoreductase
MMARIRKKTILLSHLVLENMKRLELKKANLHLAYHYPCHLKLLADPECSAQMLAGIAGIDLEKLQTGCCGMAGAWGMHADHFQLSQKIGENLNKQLAVSKSVLAVTDCPTCELQMKQFSNKPIRHPIEILADLLHLT